MGRWLCFVHLAYESRGDQPVALTKEEIKHYTEIKMDMVEQLEGIEARYREIEDQLLDPGVSSRPDLLRDLGREQAELREVVETYKRYKKVLKEISETIEMRASDDKELAQLAEDELKRLEGEKDELESRLQELVTPRDPLSEKNVILEIRAGTGGEEAALFARDLFELYSRYASERGWRVQVLNHNATGRGGFKELIALVEGKGVYGTLRHESGVHRVQRVPVTESQGRIHTSTVTVAVLPEAEDVEVEVNDKDIKVDVFRSQGPGGQGVNTTDSAVRITHIPTGMVVTCQDERSQHKNKSRAMKILKARLLDMEEQRREDERAGLRRSQVGTGERSEKVRTYNFPQNRVTDHRVNLTLKKLDRVMMGDLDDIVDALLSHNSREFLNSRSSDK
jgi:peptide chain release factor 1